MWRMRNMRFAAQHTHTRTQNSTFLISEKNKREEWARGCGGRERGRERGLSESSLVVCDNVLDYQMQHTSFAYQTWISLIVSAVLHLSLTTYLSLSLTLRFLLPFCALKFNLHLTWPALQLPRSFALTHYAVGIYCAYASLRNEISKLQIFIRLEMIFMTYVCVVACVCASLSINCCLHKAAKKENFSIA